MSPGEKIGIHIDQTLTQDATVTMVMLELEPMGLDQARTELSVQYVDHNLISERQIAVLFSGSLINWTRTHGYAM
jgi:aconitate hydratase